MTAAATLNNLLTEFHHRRPIRAGSLIITVFGDSISQHGNCVWLGSLIRALEPFGLSQRLVRTSVYRLIQDDWLRSIQKGRKSYYSFTESGLRHYEHAARRIYACARQPWDGRWTLVISTDLAEDAREKLRKELAWLGYGNLSRGVMAHPSAERGDLEETLHDLGVQDSTLVMQASAGENGSQEAMQQLIANHWDIKELESRYQSFIKSFQAFAKSRKMCSTLSDAECFQLRTLLIHEYRRILLKDKDLPSELLPGAWSGSRAQDLVSQLYHQLEHRAEQFLMQNFESSEGPLPEVVPQYFARFGGLDSLN